jgi:hypothetical protein
MNIKKTSRLLYYFFSSALIIIPIASALLWYFIDTLFIKQLVSDGIILQPVQTPETLVNLSTVHWDVITKSIAFIAFMIGLLPILLSFYFLARVFNNYQHDEIFTVRNAHYFKKIGFLFFLDAFITKPLSTMLMIVAITLRNAPGHRYISLSFGTTNAQAILCGIVVIIVSCVMLQASRLHEEQQLTV